MMPSKEGQEIIRKSVKKGGRFVDLLKGGLGDKEALQRYKKAERSRVAIVQSVLNPVGPQQPKKKKKKKKGPMHPMDPRRGG
jgi:hypothetical protein